MSEPYYQDDSRGEPCVCGDVLRRRFAAMDTETYVCPMRDDIKPTSYEPLNLRCPHGVLWHAEPTSEQRLAWGRDGVL